MLFNSYLFLLLFFPITLLGYYLARKNSIRSTAWLIVASIVFYSIGDAHSLPILLTSITANYFLGKNILATEKFKYLKLMIGISINLVFIGYFKYMNFFIENINTAGSYFGYTTQLEIKEILLPIGISFFTFTQIAFLIDCYNSKLKSISFIEYLLLVTYFPHLIAGPILHHKEIIPQLNIVKNQSFNIRNIEIGFFIFTVGLIKKILLADTLSQYADSIFNMLGTPDFQPSFFLSWFGAICYTLQLYFDFSGYSDMAIGISLVFGIYLPKNFNSPLKSLNIIKFWQNWHMSLTNYVKAYLYTPIALRFMRVGLGKNIYKNFLYCEATPTIITFTILGLWHGANWTFIIFGLMHGTFIVINHLWQKVKLLTLHKTISWSITFASVIFSFVIFRSSNVEHAILMYRGMLGLNNIYLPNFLVELINFGTTSKDGIWQGLITKQAATQMILCISVCMVITLLMPNLNSLTDKKPCNNVLPLMKNKAIHFFLGILLGLCLISINKTSPFLYFQF